MQAPNQGSRGPPRRLGAPRPTLATVASRRQTRGQAEHREARLASAATHKHLSAGLGASRLACCSTRPDATRVGPARVGLAPPHARHAPRARARALSAAHWVEAALWPSAQIAGPCCRSCCGQVLHALSSIAAAQKGRDATCQGQGRLPLVTSGFGCLWRTRVVGRKDSRLRMFQ